MGGTDALGVGPARCCLGLAGRKGRQHVAREPPRPQQDWGWGLPKLRRTVGGTGRDRRRCGDEGVLRRRRCWGIAGLVALASNNSSRRLRGHYLPPGVLLGRPETMPRARRWCGGLWAGKRGEAARNKG